MKHYDRDTLFNNKFALGTIIPLLKLQYLKLCNKFSLNKIQIFMPDYC